MRIAAHAARRILAGEYIITLAVGLASCSAQPSPSKVQASSPAHDGEVITVRMSNFEFDPNDIRLKAGLPVRLRLVNVSGGGHNFSAPSFFAVSRSPQSPSAPPHGTVEVPAHQTVEIALVPLAPGTYSLECTHLLHSTFGMHGTIEVMP